MLNRILFGIVGSFMVGAMGVGASELRERFAAEAPENTTVAIEAEHEAETADSGAPSSVAPASLGTQSPAPALSSGVSPRIETCISVAHERDDDGDEDEDEDGAVAWNCAVAPSAATPSPAPTPTPVPAAHPAPQPAPTPAVMAYAMTDVGIHNSAASCWSAINGSVYDLTSFVSQHPGGQAAIKSLCGVDGSAAFNGQHGGQARPASELASLKIGVLAP